MLYRLDLFRLDLIRLDLIWLDMLQRCSQSQSSSCECFAWLYVMILIYCGGSRKKTNQKYHIGFVGWFGTEN